MRPWRKHAWPGQRAIGKRMHAGNPKRPYPWATVIGVVADTKVGAPDQPGNEQFYAASQQAHALYGAAAAGSRTQAAAGYITLRSTLPPEQMTQTLRSAVAGVDPLLPLQQVQPMDEVISNVEAPRRFNTVLITAFADRRSAAGDYRHLCGGGVLGFATDAGDCDPHGAGRAARWYRAAGAGLGREAGAAGMWAWAAWLAGGFAGGERIPVWCERDRSAGLHWRGCDDDADGAAGVGASGVAGGFRRSDRCFAVELRIDSPSGFDSTLPIPLVLGKVESVPALRANVSVTTTANHPVAPLESLGLETANDVFFRLVEFDGAEAILQQDAGGFWHPISAREVYARVHSLAQALLGWGIAKGDRIAILAENRWEWAVTDFAVLAIGAVDVPIYPTLTGEQTAVLLADSGSRIAFVSTREQYEKVAAVRGQTHLERIVMMDSFAPDAGIDAVAFLLADAERRRLSRAGCGVRSAGEGGPAGGSGDDYLYLGHDGRAEGRDAEPRQHRARM